MTVQDEPTAAGTWDAFEAEAMPHVDRLFRLAMWWERDRADAEDLVQETLVQALQSFHRFTLGTNCRAWLITILQHVRSNRRRAKARQPTVEDPDGRPGSPDGRRAARRRPGTAGELPGHHPAVRRGGDDLQGDRGRFDDSHRNGHVAPAPRTQGAAAAAGTDPFWQPVPDRRGRRRTTRVTMECREVRELGELCHRFPIRSDRVQHE